MINDKFENLLNYDNTFLIVFVTKLNQGVKIILKVKTKESFFIHVKLSSGV